MLALSIAATGMLAQQLNVEVISNNIANMNTTGHKRQRAEFQDLLYQDVANVGAATSDTGTVAPTGIQIGVGVATAGVYRNHEQGSLQSTGNNFDLAISGRGFFRIQQPSGATAYTRAGSFQMSPQGQLVTAQGFVVSPGITIPQDAISVTISATGSVQALIASQTAPQTVGQLDLATFFNEAGLQSIGDNLLLESSASGAPVVGTPGGAGFGTVRQGYVENSNVNPVQEITSLIAAQRAYEMNSKVITTADEMLSVVTQLR
jgi:flagellar basal-body rod protein FlgG